MFSCKVVLIGPETIRLVTKLSVPQEEMAQGALGQVANILGTRECLFEEARG